MIDLERFVASQAFAADSSHEGGAVSWQSTAPPTTGPDEVPVDVDYRRRSLEAVPQHQLAD